MSRPSDRDYIIEETEWLLKNGMSPLYIPTALGKTPSALAKLLLRAGRTDLSNLFNYERNAA